MITIELDDELSGAIEKLAADEHKPIQQIVRDALIEMIEDYHDTKAAEAAIARIESGESTTISLEEWEKQLDDMAR